MKFLENRKLRSEGCEFCVKKISHRGTENFVSDRMPHPGLMIFVSDRMSHPYLMIFSMSHPCNDNDLNTPMMCLRRKSSPKSFCFE